MSLSIAFKAFLKAWKNPKAGERFIEEQEVPKIQNQEISSDNSHLRLLALLQQSGRLIDFLKEDIKGFSDAQIGAAARKIHEDCSKSLEELITIRPVMQENEGAIVNVPAGYDPCIIKVVGKVKGSPPFNGILVHKGWKAHKRSLPKKINVDANDIITPAEIEIK